jgi:hypothetical protein
MSPTTSRGTGAGREATRAMRVAHATRVVREMRDSLKISTRPSTPPKKKTRRNSQTQSHPPNKTRRSSQTQSHPPNKTRRSSQTQSHPPNKTRRSNRTQSHQRKRTLPQGKRMRAPSLMPLRAVRRAHLPMSAECVAVTARAAGIR